MASHGYGWKRQLPDQRDYKYTLAIPTVLPPLVDMTGKCPPVYDQETLGSCTGNAIAGAVEFERIKQGLVDFVPSRLFIYYEERVIENTVNSDSGAEIRDGFKVISSLGVPAETDWPYDVSKFTQKPPQQAYDDALKDVATQYLAINQDLTSFRQCLSDGYPFVFGFTVYSSFESDQVNQSGIVPMPSPTESVLGGHAVMCVGYDDNAKEFIVRNSWGPKWAQNGYFRMPYQYLTNPDLASDFWTLRLVSS